MGLRDMLKGRNMILSDKDIINDMLKDSKFGLVGLTFAMTECTNPQLRGILMDQFGRCAAEHHALTDLAVRKNWYPVYEPPTQQIRNDLLDSEKAIH